MADDFRTRVESRSLTGAWIETTRATSMGAGWRSVAPSRERGLKRYRLHPAGRIRGRSLTGAWIETASAYGASPPNRPVAPSRERGLKQELKAAIARPRIVAPSRERGLKLATAQASGAATGRSLTGAWIETRRYANSSVRLYVAPSRERGLKRRFFRASYSHPVVAPSRERGLKPTTQPAISRPRKSLPHGSGD